MRIQPEQFARLRDSKRGEYLATIFEALVQGIDDRGEAMLIVDWTTPEDIITESDLVPSLVLSLRPAIPKDTGDVADSNRLLESANPGQ